MAEILELFPWNSQSVFFSELEQCSNNRAEKKELTIKKAHWNETSAVAVLKALGNGACVLEKGMLMMMMMMRIMIMTGARSTTEPTKTSRKMRLVEVVKK